MTVIVPGTTEQSSPDTVDIKSLYHPEWRLQFPRHQTSRDSSLSDAFHCHLGKQVCHFEREFFQCLVHVGVSGNDTSSLIGSEPLSLWQPAHEVELYICYTRMSRILNVLFPLHRQMGDAHWTCPLFNFDASKWVENKQYHLGYGHLSC